MIRFCENIAKIVCKTSRLKSGDFMLKGLPQTFRACSLCDNYVVENIEHIVMQCPNFEVDREAMFYELGNVNPTFGQKMAEHHSEVLYWMLGGQIDALSFEEMLEFWVTSGRSINCMYTSTVKARSIT